MKERIVESFAPKMAETVKNPYKLFLKIAEEDCLDMTQDLESLVEPMETPLAGADTAMPWSRTQVWKIFATG